MPSQEHFSENETIFAPATVGRWRPPSECVWDGPDFMQTKSVLKSHYGHIPALENLFVNDLKIRDSNVDDMLEELINMQASTSDDVDDREDIALQIYESLHTMTASQGPDDFEAVKYSSNAYDISDGYTDLCIGNVSKTTNSSLLTEVGMLQPRASGTLPSKSWVDRPSRVCIHV